MLFRALAHSLRFAAPLVAALGVALPATIVGAQETQPAAATKEAVRATHGDWEIRCRGKVCVMTQTFKDKQNRPVVAVSITRLKEPVKTKDDKTVVAGIRVVTPLNVLLPRGLGLQIDEGKRRWVPFLVCTQIGCISESTLEAEVLKELEAGGVAQFLTAVPTREGIRLAGSPISLKGFTAAFKDLEQ